MPETRDPAPSDNSYTKKYRHHEPLGPPRVSIGINAKNALDPGWIYKSEDREAKALMTHATRSSHSRTKLTKPPRYRRIDCPTLRDSRTVIKVFGHRVSR